MDVNIIYCVSEDMHHCGNMEIQIDGKTYTELTRWVDKDGIEHIEFVPLNDFIKWNETH